jgi:hypothetical protein
MYKSKFIIDDDQSEENIMEGYTDGTLWNGWANVCFTREQVSRWLDASPYDYRFLEAKTTLNKRDYPALLIYFDDREETIESTSFQTDSGETLEGYFMEGYCFVEIDKQVTLSSMTNS